MVYFAYGTVVRFALCKDFICPDHWMTVNKIYEMHFLASQRVGEWKMKNSFCSSADDPRMYASKK